MRATYNYKHYGYERGIETYTVPVEVLGETKSSYKVRLLMANIRGRKYGDVIWVRKSSVTMPKQPKEPRDCSEDYWNNF